MDTASNIIRFELGEGVEAFTAGRDAVLPYEVTVGHQVHGIKVAEVSRPGMTREELEGYDALVTNVPGCAIGVRTADCIPVLLYDPVRRVVGAAHAGWRGTVNRVVQKTIFKMVRLYHTKPSDILALVGPGISVKHFQVGEEVVEGFKDNGFPIDLMYQWQGPKRPGMIGGHHVDLKEANRWLLSEAGVPDGNIIISDLCTFTEENLYSARREGNACGRNINAIMLR